MARNRLTCRPTRMATPLVTFYAKRPVMTNYAVFLEGEDFELSHSGAKELLGFFVTVRVEARSESEAESRAIQRVRSDPQLSDAFKAEAGATPKVKAKVVHQLLLENRMADTAYTFFPMGEG